MKRDLLKIPHDFDASLKAALKVRPPLMKKEKKGKAPKKK